MGLLLASPVDNLRILASYSEKFQELVDTTHGGGADQANALNYIFRGAAPGSQASPLIVVGPNGGRSVVKDSATTWNVEGPLAISFELVVPDANKSDPDAAFAAAMLDVETMIEEMAAKSLEGGFLAVQQFNEDVAPLPGDPKENQGRHWYWSQWSVSLEGSG